MHASAFAGVIHSIIPPPCVVRQARRRSVRETSGFQAWTRRPVERSAQVARPAAHSAFGVLETNLESMPPDLFDSSRFVTESVAASKLFENLQESLS